nr:hypothetical protein [Lachnospiraceae bacterium]
MTIFLWVCAILVNIKSMFSDYDIDSAYALAMSYRHLTGDGLFREMLEPHQTSAFLTDLLLFPFMKLTCGTTGAVLWLHLWGILLYALVTFLLFRFLKKRVDLRLAHCICILFFTMRAKQIVFPEFSNMLIGFSVLVCILFTLFLEQQQKTSYLLWTAFFLCLGVLSYPSFLIAFFALVYLLCRFSENKGRNVWLFTASCGLFGVIYAGYFVITCSFDTLLEAGMHIVSGDSSHSGSKLVSLFSPAANQDLLLGLIWGLVAILIARAVSVLSHKKIPFLLVAIAAFTVMEAGYIVYFRTLPNMGYYVVAIVFIPIMIAGFVYRAYCSESQSLIYRVGMMLSLCTMVSVALLTNLGIITVLWYGIMGACVSLIPIWGRINGDASPEINRMLETEGSAGETATATKKAGATSRMSFFVLLLLLFMVHRGLLRPDITNHTNSLQIGSYYKAGPALGILSTYFPAFETSKDVEEWPNAVTAGDKLLLVGSANCINTTAYLYAPVEISHYSTICTPTYDALLLEYWDKYPEKKPTVVGVECWYGELHVDTDSWIYGW